MPGAAESISSDDLFGRPVRRPNAPEWSPFISRATCAGRFVSSRHRLVRVCFVRLSANVYPETNGSRVRRRPVACKDHCKMEVKSIAEKRLRKELLIILRHPEIVLDRDKIEQNINVWNIHIQGPENTLFAGEKFELEFKFKSSYPFNSPEVAFVGPNIPIHPKVYSNGHICLSILSDDWSPTFSIYSVYCSIMAMLRSCLKKVPPQDNIVYLESCKEDLDEQIQHFASLGH